VTSIKIDCELLVVGGGPAGCSAAVNAYSLGISVQIIERAGLGGQIREIERIGNLLGGPYSGLELAASYAKQVTSYKIPVINSEVISVKKLRDCWEVQCSNSEIRRAKIIIAATGTRELRIREHHLAKNVDPRHSDQFIYSVPFEELTSKDVIIVGCDRVLLSLVASRGQELARCRIRVLALPDKWYVIKERFETLPFEIIKLEKILCVDADAIQERRVRFSTEDGTEQEIRGDLLLTNLGKVPNSELFLDCISADEEGYLTPKEYLRDPAPPNIYAVGDVAHKAFQRISVAIGDGSYAALDYFYCRDKVYPHRT
jgi:thioredoxin reductase